MTDTTRRCRTCEQVKQLTEFDGFTSKKQNTYGKRYCFPDCKDCRAEVARKKRYGVTLADMVERQESTVCPLCLKREATCVDHDHGTGEPRGALCRKCNLIMHYMDDEQWVERARAYRCQQSPKPSGDSSTE